MNKKECTLNDESLNNVVGGSNGGAIYGSGEVSISGGNVTYTDNAPGIKAGGAIYNSGEVDISGGNVQFSKSTDGAAGGAIYTNK